VAYLASSPAEHVRLCIAEVWCDGEFRGTAFFVGPQLLLTCAHVVPAADAAVALRWQGQELAGRVLVRDPPDGGGADFYPEPDLAFVGLDHTLDHPTVAVAVLQQRLARDDDLDVYGFTAHTPYAGVAPDVAALRVLGTVGAYTKVLSSQIVPGLSGAPVFDPVSQQVCGVLKAVDPETKEAGWFVQGSAVQAVADRRRGSLRRHLASRPRLFRPAPGEPLHEMLLAQRRVAEQLPYRLVEGPLPMSAVYVAQQARDTRDTLAVPPEEMLRRHRNALLVGGPGTGKSTLLQHLVAESAGWWLRGEPVAEGAEPAAGPVVAIRVAATDLLRRGPWFESVARAVSTDLRGYLSLRPDPEMFMRPPAPGAQWMVLVDGLDEVLDPGRRAELVDMLAHRVGEYGSQARFVVTSRRLVEYEFRALRVSLTGTDRLDRLGEYTIRPFDEHAVRTFASRWFTLRAPSHVDERVAGLLARISEGNLDPLVRVPLLLTIAAVVYEQDPRSPLPFDRAGLYQRFVTTLLVRRHARLTARELLLEQLRGLGEEAEEFGDFLFDHRHDCLRYLGDRRMRSDPRPATEIVREWTVDAGRPVPSTVEEHHLREVLLSTGLVVLQGEDLGFIHQSFAEYLAAEHRAGGFRPDRWLAEVKAGGLTSAAMFALAHWVSRGNDPVPVMRGLLAPGRARTFPHLRHAAAILEDGGVLGRSQARLLEMTLAAAHAARVSADDARAAVLGQVYRAVRQRSRDPSILVDLAGDARLAVVKRIEAARLLAAEEGEPARRLGREILPRLAYHQPMRVEDRLWAIRVVAEAGGQDERGYAIQRLAQAVETSGSEAHRFRAVALLAALDELPAAASALLRRAADPGRPVTDRVRATEALSVLYSPALFDSTGGALPHTAGAWHVGSRTWRNTDRYRGRDRAVLGSATSFYHSSMRDALVMLGDTDPDAAGAVAATVMRDRGLGWSERVRLAYALGGDAAPDTRAAMDILADDRMLPLHNRIISRLLFTGGRQRAAAAGEVAAWAGAPARTPVERAQALYPLSWFGDEELAFDTARDILRRPDSTHAARLDATAFLARRFPDRRSGVELALERPDRRSLWSWLTARAALTSRRRSARRSPRV
jgi:hypothetical protein